MSETDYVRQYLQLETAATERDSQARLYARLADADRWSMCRLAHDATTKGGLTRQAFAEAVGRSRSHIGKQCVLWNRYGDAVLQGEQHPNYDLAYHLLAPRPKPEYRTVQTPEEGVVDYRRQAELTTAADAADLAVPYEKAADPPAVRRRRDAEAEAERLIAALRLFHEAGHYQHLWSLTAEELVEELEAVLAEARVLLPRHHR
jgi:hypothetical protein